MDFEYWCTISEISTDVDNQWFSAARQTREGGVLFICNWQHFYSAILLMSALLGQSALMRLDGWQVELRLRREERQRRPRMCIWAWDSVLGIEADLNGTGNCSNLYTTISCFLSNIVCSRGVMSCMLWSWCLWSTDERFWFCLFYVLFFYVKCSPKCCYRCSCCQSAIWIKMYCIVNRHANNLSSYPKNDCVNFFLIDQLVDIVSCICEDILGA